MECMHDELFRHIDLLIGCVLKMSDRQLNSFLKHIKLDLLLAYCCKHSRMFAKDSGHNCYTILMRYFES